MASTTALWFDVETHFAELEQMCTEARAAELIAQGSHQERTVRIYPGGPDRPGGPGSSGAPGAMVEEDRTVPIQVGRHAKAEDLARDLAFRDAHAAGPDLVALRERLRKRLVWLRARFAEVLSEHVVYSALFPIVAYADELVQSATRGGTLLWEPLQSELYDVDNAGEVFYTMLEEQLRQDETLPIVFQIFYFCLSDGFAGMYAHDRKKVEEYKARVSARIPLAPVEQEQHRPPKEIELVPFPWRYYAVAAGVVVTVYVLLSWAGAA